jgi:hypothetical protein
MAQYRIVYQTPGQDAPRRELLVEAADEGGAYDQAMQEMAPDEALIEVVAA